MFFPDYQKKIFSKILDPFVCVIVELTPHDNPQNILRCWAISPTNCTLLEELQVDNLKQLKELTH